MICCCNIASLLSLSPNQFGCDAMRMVLGRAGDLMANANFDLLEARAYVVTLHVR